MNLGSFIIENYLCGSNGDGNGGSSRDGDGGIGIGGGGDDDDSIGDTVEKSFCVTQLSLLFSFDSVVISSFSLFLFLLMLCVVWIVFNPAICFFRSIHTHTHGEIA